VWWLWKPDGIWIPGTYIRVCVQAVMHDPRASLCIVSGPRWWARRVRWPLPRSSADFDIWPISPRWPKSTSGGRPANAAAVDSFFANMQTEPRLLFRLEPEVTRAIDMRVYRGKRGDREFQAGQRDE